MTMAMVVVSRYYRFSKLMAFSCSRRTAFFSLIACETKIKIKENFPSSSNSIPFSFSFWFHSIFIIQCWTQNSQANVHLTSILYSLYKIKSTTHPCSIHPSARRHHSVVLIFQRIFRHSLCLFPSTLTHMHTHIHTTTEHIHIRTRMKHWYDILRW